MTPGNRYFYFDEATDSFIELMEQGPSRLVRVFVFMAGVLLLASVLVRYVFDRTMARTFLLGLINGASARRGEKRLLQMPPPAQVREPVTPARG